MPEISDSELAVARKYKAVIDKMWNDPESGLDFKRKVKAIVPDAQIPELDMIDTTVKPIQEQLAKKDEAIKTLTERLDKWEKSHTDEREESELSKTLDAAKSRFKLTEDGMEKVIARMKEKNNPDAEAAAAWVAQMEKKAKPISGASFSPSAINLYGSNSEDDSWKALNQNPEKWFDNEVATMMNEFAQEDAA